VLPLKVSLFPQPLHSFIFLFPQTPAMVMFYVAFALPLPISTCNR
jgi:hypothetical protein